MNGAGEFCRSLIHLNRLAALESAGRAAQASKEGKRKLRAMAEGN